MVHEAADGRTHGTPTAPGERTGTAPITGSGRSSRGRRARHVLGAATRFRVAQLGPVGVGKTTAVRALSDVPTIGTDVALSTPERTAAMNGAGKTTTTVGIDYGIWKPRPGMNVALVGTPGQERFGAVRSALMAPHTRVVLWLFGDRPGLAEQAWPWLVVLRGADMMGRTVVALTRTTETDSARTELHRVAHDLECPPPLVTSADPRDRNSVMRVVARALDIPENR